VTAGKPATSEGPKDRPRTWDSWVSAAFLRALGVTQKDAARASGIGLRTLCRYEKDPRWPLAVAEAEERWLQGLDTHVRQRLLEALSGEPDDRLLMWYAERRFPELAPPVARHRPSQGRDLQNPITVGGIPAGVMRGTDRED